MFIVITPENNPINELEVIHRLFVSGLQCLHVRKPLMKSDELREWIKNIREEYHCKLMLHQHHELVSEFDVKGIHLKENQRKNMEDITAYIQGFRQRNKKVSTGFHQLNECEESSQKYDYSFLSPIFKSVSKANCSGMQWDVNALQQKPIALGGITEKNIHRAKKMGYGGIAVLGSIWNALNPIQAFSALKNKYDGIYG